MPVVASGRPALVLMPCPGTAPGHVDHPLAAKTCRRCRRTFARHPSICSEDFSPRWLCPPCRHGPAQRTSGARLRIVSAIGPDRSPRPFSSGQTG